MNVWSISASISVTIVYIFTQFGTEHKCHAINTSEWPNSHNLKIQHGGGRHLEFRKIVNNSGLDKDICAKFYGKMHHGHVEMTTWPKDEAGCHKMNVRSISASISLCEYNRYLNQIGTQLKFLTVYMLEWSNSQPQNTRCRLPPSWIFRLCEIKKCQ